jgi:hypothetical protein
MSLEAIAEDIGTTTEEQQQDDFGRFGTPDDDMGDLDVQNEYDGGWTNTNA